MKLREIIGLLKVIDVTGNLEAEFSGIAYDSRKLKEGDCFFAMAGSRSSGTLYSQEAVRKGAAAIITEGEVPPLPIPVIRIADIRGGMADVAHSYYGHPTLSMVCTGITGTNGKTTTSYLIDAIVKQRYQQTAVVGTLGMAWKDSRHDFGLTTPESPTIASELAQLKAEGCLAVTMEVSSHGLVLSRVRGIEFDCAVFTNLSRDHLDFHGDMESYLEAKLSLFRVLGKGKKRGKGIVNLDDPRGRRFIDICPVETVTYAIGSEKADVRAADFRLHPWGSEVTVRSPLGETHLRLQLPGKFNVSNALAAFAAGIGLNLSEAEIVRGLESIERVRGRMEIVEAGGVRVVIDYAHSPDALENLLTTLEEIYAGRIITVVGCGGDRDREKRPVMGEVAARLSHLLVITSDNPRREDPEAILDSLEGGVRRVRDDFTRITDREDAIRYAIGAAKAGDIVVIAGKGHEDYQIIGSQRYPFSDREVACRILGCSESEERGGFNSHGH